MRRAAAILLLLSLSTLAGCGWLDSRRARSPLGRGCTLGFLEDDGIENVMGVLERLDDDWVVLSEADGTTVWVRRDRVVWMRVRPRD
jgi:hypothetical protein